MARRFIVEKDNISCINEQTNIFKITGKEVKHIHILRHEIGDEITINNYVFEIDEIKKDSIILKRIRLAEKKGEPNIHLTLYMAMLKNDKMDFVVQKAVELGIKRIVPFFSKNVIVKLDEKARIKRREKLQIIANEACKQCGRTDLVEIGEFIDFNKLILELPEYDKNIFAYENENINLKSEIAKIKSEKIKKLSIIIGAEGGFDNTEANIIKGICNVLSVSLGTRILRAETASLNLISIIMYELDDKKGSD